MCRVFSIQQFMCVYAARSDITEAKHSFHIVDDFAFHKIEGADALLYNFMNDVPASTRRGGIDPPVSLPILKKCSQNRTENAAPRVRRVRWDPSSHESTREEPAKFRTQQPELGSLIASMAGFSMLALVLSQLSIFYLFCG